MVVDIVGRQQAKAIGPRKLIEPLDPGDIVTAVKITGRKVPQCWKLVDKVRKQFGQRRCQLHGLLAPNRIGSVAFRRAAIRGRRRCGTRERDHVARHGDGDRQFQIIGRDEDQLHAFGMAREQRKIDLAHALVLPFAAERLHPPGADQAAQPAIGGAVLRIGEESQPLDGFDPAADQRSDLERLGLGVDAHHAGHRIDVGYPQRIVAQRMRGQH